MLLLGLWGMHTISMETVEDLECRIRLEITVHEEIGSSSMDARDVSGGCSDARWRGNLVPAFPIQRLDSTADGKKGTCK